jgi:hypothetical protein
VPLDDATGFPHVLGVRELRIVMTAVACEALAAGGSDYSRN